MKEETLQNKIRFDGRVFQVEEQLVRLQDGSTASREIVRHSGGAAIVAVDAQQCVILVRQYRKAAEQILLEIPAGRIEPGESPAQCAQRELAEETGYRTDSLSELASFYPTPGYCSERLHVFYTTRIQLGLSAPDDGEFVTVERVPLSACLDYVRDGRIRDAKTIIGVLLVAERQVAERQAAASGQSTEMRGDGGV